MPALQGTVRSLSTSFLILCSLCFTIPLSYLSSLLILPLSPIQRVVSPFQGQLLYLAVNPIFAAGIPPSPYSRTSASFANHIMANLPRLNIILFSSVMSFEMALPPQTSSLNFSNTLFVYMNKELTKPCNITICITVISPAKL